MLGLLAILIYPNLTKTKGHRAPHLLLGALALLEVQPGLLPLLGLQVQALEAQLAFPALLQLLLLVPRLLIIRQLDLQPLRPCMIALVTFIAKGFAHPVSLLMMYPCQCKHTEQTYHEYTLKLFSTSWSIAMHFSRWQKADIMMQSDKALGIQISEAGASPMALHSVYQGASVQCNVTVPWACRRQGSKLGLCKVVIRV